MKPGRMRSWAGVAWQPALVVLWVALLAHGVSLWAVPRIVNAPLLAFATQAAQQGVWRPVAPVQALSAAQDVTRADGSTQATQARTALRAAPWADPAAILALCPLDLKRQPALHLRWPLPVLRPPGHWELTLMAADGERALQQAGPVALAPPGIPGAATSPHEVHWWVHAGGAVGAMAPDGAQALELSQTQAVAVLRIWPAAGDSAAAQRAVQALQCGDGRNS
jgi:hypothetical protein